MNRRRFLTLTGVATGACVAARAGSAGAPDALETARRRARLHGKPLLLIPVPAEPPVRAELSVPWQNLFSSASDETLAIMALVEVVFATLPKGVEFELGRDAALWSLGADDDWRVVAHHADGTAPARLAEQLRAALVPDQAALDALSQKCSLSRPPASCAAGAHWTRDADWPRVKLSEVDRVAAWYWRQAEGSGRDREWYMRVLADAAALRLYEEDPLGARWEEPPAEDPCPACGMAVMPPRSRLFLDAYTR